MLQCVHMVTNCTHRQTLILTKINYISKFSSFIQHTNSKICTCQHRHTLCPHFVRWHKIPWDLRKSRNKQLVYLWVQFLLYSPTTQIYLQGLYNLFSKQHPLSLQSLKYSWAASMETMDTCFHFDKKVGDKWASGRWRSRLALLVAGNVSSSLGTVDTLLCHQWRRMSGQTETAFKTLDQDITMTICQNVQ